MRAFRHRNGIQRTIDAIHGPFVAVIRGYEKKLDRMIYTVQGLGSHDREEVEVMAGSPMIEWMAKGTEVLIVPHLFETDELFIVGRAHVSAIIDLLAEEGDFALERNDGTFALFKKGELVLKAQDDIVIDAPVIKLGLNAVGKPVLVGDVTSNGVYPIPGNQTHYHLLQTSSAQKVLIE